MMDHIDVALSILGWIATGCRAVGMFVKDEKVIKYWTTAGNIGWMVVGIIQWQALHMSMTLFTSNFICIAVFLYSLYNMKK